jgi:hypothetical protein
MKHTSHPLAFALDPTLLFKVRGMDPDPWQAELLTSTQPRILLNCSRQAGKSTTVAALSLHTALFRPRSMILLVSRSLRQSSELFRKVLEFYDAAGEPVPAIARSRLELELVNGSRIVSLPSKEETVRCYSGVTLLLIDEAARVPNTLYRALRPMLAASNGRLICLSTPYGRRGFFYREWTDEAGPWLRFEIPVDRVPRISPEFLAEEKRIYSRSWFAQEYSCSFEALEGLVYPDFDQCLVDELPPEVAGHFPGEYRDRARFDPTPPPVRWFGGIDFGYKDPFAAVWGFRDRQDVLWIVGEHYQKRLILPEVVGHLPRGVRWYADPTGPGLIEWLRKSDVVVNAGINDRKTGHTLVAGRIQSGRLKVLAPACPNLVREMGLYHFDGEEGSGSESTSHAYSHSPDALRYLISRLDERQMNRIKNPTGSPPSQNPWLDWRNPELWTPLN